MHLLLWIGAEPRKVDELQVAIFTKLLRKDSSPIADDNARIFSSSENCLTFAIRCSFVQRLLASWHRQGVELHFLFQQMPVSAGLVIVSVFCVNPVRNVNARLGRTKIKKCE